jgi:hypothetical protein
VDGVVVPPPALDDDPGVAEAVEDLPVEEFIAELGVENLAVAVRNFRPSWMRSSTKS